MAVSAPTATGTSPVSGTAAIATQNDAGSADRFLKLLVAQMRNQDPLNPMDNARRRDNDTPYHSPRRSTPKVAHHAIDSL